MDVWKVLVLWGLLEHLVLCLCQGRHTLPVLWIMPFTDELGCGNITETTLPAVHLAQQHLRKQPAPLGNYELEFHFANSQDDASQCIYNTICYICDNAIGLKAFFDAICHGPKYLMIFGGVCPSVTSIIAESLQGWNLVQLSFAVTAPAFEDKRRYPNFFRIVPSDNAIHPAVIKFVKHYNWNRVGILTQDGQGVSEVQRDLMKVLLRANIQIAATQNFIGDPSVSLRILKENDVRIIIGLFNESTAAKIFCSAYHLNMFSSRYQWVIPRWNQRNWWVNRGTVNCSSLSLMEAMEGSISVDFEPLSSKETRGISGKTPQEYQKEYDQLCIQKGVNSSRFHGFAYDAIWVVTKALTRVMEAMRHNEKYSLHHNYTVSDEELSQMIIEAMNETTFLGVTGQVRFKNGERMGIIRFTQLQDGSEIQVGEYNTIEDRLDLSKNMRFTAKGPPRDITMVLHQRGQINIVVYSILSAISILGMLMASSFLFFNIKHRHHRIIQMSSPFINNIIILGGMLSYSFVIIFGLDGSLISDGSFEILCKIRSWILSIGFTMAFGAMFAKTWRVYAIFKNVHLKKKVIKDLRLLVVVGGMLLIDLCILICWHFTDPLRRTVEEYRTEVDGNDVALYTLLERCESAHTATWLAILFVYKGVLMVFCCFLSWETRHVSIPVLNDSQYIGWSVYNVAVMCMIGAIASVLTRELPNVQFCIISLVIIISTTGTLLLLFIPKFKLSQTTVRKDQWRSSSISSAGQNKTFWVEDNQNYNELLRRRVAELDSELVEINMQLDGIPVSHNFPEPCSEYVVITHADISEKCCTLPEDSRTDDDLLRDINSPERIQRRLSVQLPILHHAYLPSIGGVNASLASPSTPLDSPAPSP
ncbi:gamma-aminobutyric acid type B receptor subunit 2-like [Alosa alosa]|nr:gamma-aminobutyric acid type B receptor subunit 2-like [Alosa alosa]